MRGNAHCNIFEDVVAEEHAFQFVGSANSHLTGARSVTAKKYARQCLGDVSDTTIQQISRNSIGILSKEECPPRLQQSKNFQVFSRGLN
ncbi:hypothetical protein N7540_013168 [Penicillium herquei]|nr:hypothetical protein N7540_013168 [Penicillium herquei]